MTDTAYIVIREDRLMTDLIVDEGSYSNVVDVTDDLKDDKVSASEVWQTQLTVRVYESCAKQGLMNSVRTSKLTRSDRKLIRQDPDAAAQRLGMDLVVYLAKDNSYTVHMVSTKQEKEAA